jgi:hypothetical protein
MKLDDFRYLVAATLNRFAFRNIEPMKATSFIDRLNLVEHLLEFAIVGQKLGDLRVGRVGHIAEAWAFAGSSDRGQVSLGSVPGAVGAMAVRTPTALVGLDE